MARPPNIPQRKLPIPVKRAPLHGQVAALTGQGLALHQQGRLKEAKIIYEQVLKIQANNFDALQLLGSLLTQSREFRQAADFLSKALQINPNHAEPYYNHGNALKELGRLDEALASYDKAISIKPHYAEFHCNRGIVLAELKRFDQALLSYNQAISIKPDYAEAYHNRGNVLRDMGRQGEARISYSEALRIKPAFAEARWARAISVLPIIPSQTNETKAGREAFCQELAEMDSWFVQERLEDGSKSVGSAQPFYLAYQEENNVKPLSEYGALCGRLMSHWQQKHSYLAKPKPFSKPIKLGIVSRHIHQHSVWDALTKGWVKHLARDRFELVIFYTGTTVDEETECAKSITAGFVRHGNDLSAWVKDILAAEIDIMLYPEIGMDSMTIKLASLRLAPVQIGSWGHPETTGLATIDYYLSADLLEPDDANEYYTEQLVRLPHLGCCYEPASIVPDAIDLEKLSIAADQPLLICPGVPFKYQPRYDHVFVDIAKRLGACQFIFFIHEKKRLTDLLKERLSAQFSEAGLNSKDYFVFVPWQPKISFYSLMTQADVFLDTIGFSGFNTASQAIECRLPIVTREGRFMRGRLASGILKRIGLEELIVHDEDNYVNLVVKLARNHDYNHLVRNKIKENRHILYNDLEPVRALEKFLEDALLKATNISLNSSLGSAVMSGG